MFGMDDSVRVCKEFELVAAIKVRARDLGRDQFYALLLSVRVSCRMAKRRGSSDNICHQRQDVGHLKSI